MKYGFVRVGAITPEIKVADVSFNAASIKDGIIKAEKAGVEVLVFPELSLTGYTCADLFYSDVLLSAAKNALFEVAEFTKGKEMLVFVGLPIKKDGKIYNVAAAINKGEILGLIPKTFLPNYNEFYEKRWFSPAENTVGEVFINGKAVPFGKNIIFSEKKREFFKVAAEICEDLWSISPPSVSHSLNGATLTVNLSASNEIIGKAEYRRNLIKSHSAKCVSAYAYADAGEGESTTDTVFAGHNLIAENGTLLNESRLFETGLITADVDLMFVEYERSKLYNYDYNSDGEYKIVRFSVDNDGEINRVFGKTPFVPTEENELKSRAEIILEMQAQALKKRIIHTRSAAAVLGLSGGLDSTLAAIVAVSAMEKAGKTSKDVITITMPCFGTSSRTFDNTIKLSKALKTTLKKVDISAAVKRHLKDIKHEDGKLDAAFENAQARERTQVIMDIANMTGGLAVGTGDLSELALGWATYNGDHMSMYGVNCSIPKTLVRYLVKYYADKSKGKLKAVLYDILDTPVSPELLPAKDGEISQKTEDIVGPYELHDFYIYHFLRRGASPEKIKYIAEKTFGSVYGKETIDKWLKVFVRRFFTQQFKRSCSPDGVKVGSVALSPRGDLKMPSDAVFEEWIKELEK